MRFHPNLTPHFRGSVYAFAMESSQKFCNQFEHYSETKTEEVESGM
jgi:hypothetical protein